MATLISGVNCAENFQKVAIFGSSVGDPIEPGIGCLNEEDFDTVDSASVAISYEPALDAETPSNAPKDYANTAATNSLITIPLNNFFNDSRKVFSAVSSSLPYDKAAAELTKLANKSAASNGCAELACLITEGTTIEGTYTAPTDDASKTAFNTYLMSFVSKIRGTGANPTIAVCNPDFFSKVVIAAGSAFSSEESNVRWMNATAGMYLGVLWVSSPILAKSSIAYYDSTGTLKTVTPSTTGVNFVMWDGSKFASINRINEFAIKDGGAMFSGQAACMSSMLGVKLLEKAACLVSVTTPG